MKYIATFFAVMFFIAWMGSNIRLADMTDKRDAALTHAEVMEAGLTRAEYRVEAMALDMGRERKKFNDYWDVIHCPIQLAPDFLPVANEARKLEAMLTGDALRQHFVVTEMWAGITTELRR